MSSHVEEALGASVLFRTLSGEDRRRLAGVSILKAYGKGDRIFSEGDPSDFLFTILSGRVKVVKLVPGGREVILEIFGPGDPLGAVVAYEGRPYPATAIATEPATCVLVRRTEFFALLERHPSLVRGYVTGLARRIMELTRRIPEVAGGRVETRFAHLFLKLSDGMGRPATGGRFIPMSLSRQDLADLTGTTIETAIRIMSRWGKEGVVRTEKEGFVVLDRAALERLTR
ncbi:MAG TPA: Crp/Fnr family transcriptional regulator [Candidatus Polarisedimenticolaceae bacterium]|nr:Crp/Fnr family transcriptional regulator [Candidatus Polarisedimenticolaceae bacterium]